MMRYIAFSILCFMVVFNAPVYAQKKAKNSAVGRAEGIAVVVNEDAISALDVNARLGLTIISAGFPNRPEVREQLLPQVLRALVEEQLKMQEAAKEEIEVSEMEIDAGLAQLAQQNNMEVVQFQDMLRKSGIDPSTMKRQIKSQISWSKVIQKKFSPRVTINESDVDTFIERIRLKEGQQEYLVAEIFIPVQSPKQDKDIAKLMKNMAQQLRAGKARFSRLAQQFSKAPGAVKGGDLGWIQTGQMSKEVDDVLVEMEKGAVSGPIWTSAGYYLILLRDSRVISAKNLPPRAEVHKSLRIERLERMQAKHLMDLKAAAFIENRV